MGYLYRLYESITDYRIRNVVFHVWASINPNFVLRNKSFFLNLADFSEEEVSANKLLMTRWETGSKSIESMTWFIPPPMSITAGPQNILNFIKFFCQKGLKINIVILGYSTAIKKDIAAMMRVIGTEYEEQIKIFTNPDVSVLPYADAGIATMWHTAYALLRYNNTKAKFYFIQDDERLLYPAGIEHSLAEQSYRFGFIGITNADCLSDMYINEFGGKAQTYFLAPIRMKLTKVSPTEQIKRVFFYARPEWERNGFILGLLGLKEIKKRHPETEIITAGSKYKFSDLGLKIKNLGKVPIEQLPEFYASCDVGIYIILSQHTGAIPFELMASGCAVLTNRHYFKQSYLKHEENCLMFDLAPSSIADAFDKLYENRNLHNTLVSNGLKFISQMPSLEEEMNRIFKFMLT
jgi:glycosyltransferase involved in cell wall biosynthesis